MNIFPPGFIWEIDEDDEGGDIIFLDDFVDYWKPENAATLKELLEQNRKTRLMIKPENAEVESKETSPGSGDADLRSGKYRKRKKQ